MGRWNYLLWRFYVVLWSMREFSVPTSIGRERECVSECTLGHKTLQSKRNVCVCVCLYTCFVYIWIKHIDYIYSCTNNLLPYIVNFKCKRKDIYSIIITVIIECRLSNICSHFWYDVIQTMYIYIYIWICCVRHSAVPCIKWRKLIECTCTCWMLTIAISTVTNANNK